VIQTKATTGMRYLIAVISTLTAFTGKKIKIPFSVIIFFSVCLVTGILNIYYIGNSTIPKLLYTLMSIVIAKVLLDDRLNPDFLLWAIYFNVFIVVYNFVQHGLGAKIYFSSSNNYVSVMLLFPAVVYYSIIERQKKKISVIPAMVIFILSVLAQGRGGILASGILLIAVYLSAGFNMLGTNRRACLALCLTSMILFMFIIFSAVFLFNIFDEILIFSRFNQLGMSDHGRFAIWDQYINSVKNNLLYLGLGAKLTELPAVVRQEGNLHNSFFNIHAFNGIVMFIFFIGYSLNAIRYGIKRRRWLFVMCMFTLYLRGATDQVFWGTLGTPFVLFFILAPQFEKSMDISRVSYPYTCDKKIL